MSSLEFNASSARNWSRLGPRAVYGLALLDLVERNPQVIVASADLGNSSGLDRLKKAFPDRFIDPGIAEQNLIGLAGGIAKEGFTVFTSSFAPFITMRSCEQMRLNMGYMQLDIKAVGIGSGLSMNFLGNSHFGLEDIAVVRSIPNINIVSPADCGETIKIVDAISTSQVPTYLRLTGAPNMPTIYSSNYDFRLGKFDKLLAGDDLTIIGTGSMVHIALEVAEELSRVGFNCGVVNCHTIAPIDIDGLQKLANSTRAILTLEEHFLSGGLGSIVLETLNEKRLNIPIKRVGITNNFVKTGTYDFMLTKNQLDIRSVTSIAFEFIGELD